MKKFNFKIVTVFVLLAFFMSSCEKWIDPEVNVDPSQPEDAPMSLLLSAAEGQLAYQFGGDLGRPALMWSQQIAGVARQVLTYERYSLNSSDINNVWRWGLYSAPLFNLDIIMRKANEENSPHYGGMAKIMTAYTITAMVDVWNKIPYTQAFQGQENYTPAFDDGDAVYTIAKNMLTEAITDLSGDAGTFAPGSDDILYGGDATLWIKAANTILARIAIHRVKVDGNDVYTEALGYLANGFTDNAEDLIMPFGESALENNPVYQFDDQRGDIRMGEFIVENMKAKADPRLPLFCAEDANGEYIGAPAGEPLTAASFIGPFYASPTSPVAFITYVEAKFIEAEAKFQTNDKVGAAEAHNAAVAASMAYFGVADATDYLATYGAEDEITITLAKIMEEKYHALFMQLEVYNDYRRLEVYPELQLPTAAVLNAVARRYPYPQSEKDYNTNTPSVPSLLNRVWWDVE